MVGLLDEVGHCVIADDFASRDIRATHSFLFLNLNEGRIRGAKTTNVSLIVQKYENQGEDEGVSAVNDGLWILSRRDQNRDNDIEVLISQIVHSIYVAEGRHLSLNFFDVAFDEWNMQWCVRSMVISALLVISVFD
jgi:hypothetical protein